MKLRASLPVGALAALTLSIGGCGSSDQTQTGSERSLAIDGLYPSFDPAETRYVSRCGQRAAPIRIDAGQQVSVAAGSAEPRTGSFERSSDEIIWKLGGTETEDSLRIVGDPAVKLFGGQHDARVAADGGISVYDNSKDRPRRPRVVSYRLDLKRRTATYLG